MISEKQISSIIFLICISVCGGCKEDGDCDVKGSVCFKSQCLCPKGSVMNSDMTSCLQVSEGYGFKCEDSVQCSAVLYTGGQCLNGTCDCADGYHYLKGRCWKTSGLGDSCSRNEACYVNYDFESSVCSGRKCVCAPGYYQREYSSCRRQSNDAGDPCFITPDCQYDGAACLKNRTCGFSSQKDDQHYVIPPPWPYPIHVNTDKQLGGKCSSNHDCSGIKYAVCDSSKLCSCNAGYFSVNNSLCYPEIGSYCGSDSECIGEYMLCRGSKNWCTCEDGYVSSPDNRYCTKMSRDIDWSCLEDRWCSTFGPGGVCVNKKCHCSNNTHFVPDQLFCWTTKKVGESCGSSEDCGSTAGSESCTNGACACLAGFHSATNKTVCRPNAKHVGDFCQENLDCSLQNSVCNVTSEKCVCSPGYMLLNGACVSGVGGKCSGEGDCHAEGSSCKNNKCTCDTTHVSSSDYSHCLEVATQYMSTCTQSQQCTPLLGVGGSCEGGNCTCSQGFHIIGSICYTDIELYKTCSKSPECQVDNTNSECRNGLCQCKYQHPPDAFNRTCTGGAATVFMTTNLLLLSVYTINIIS